MDAEIFLYKSVQNTSILTAGGIFMLWSFAREDITPPEGLWQDGFANRAHASNGVLDPLHLRVAAAKSGDTAIVFIAVEALVLTDGCAYAIRRKVAQACGIRPHQVLAAATHTHGAPMSLPTENEEEYEKWWWSVEEKAANAAERALKSLRPAQFDAVSGLMRIGVNRREFTEKGVMIGENAKAVIDRRLRMLRVMGEDGKLMGAILQGACHPVCMGSGNEKYTGDWPGRACNKLESRDQSAVFLYFNGGSGDVNPKRYEDEADEQCLERTVQTFLEDAGNLLREPFTPHDDGPIASVDSEFNVPMRKPDRNSLMQTLQEWRERMAVAPDDSWDKIIGVYCGRFVEDSLQRLDEGRKPEVRAVLQAVRLAGDIAFLALPFEVFSSTSRELAMALKERGIPREGAFTVGYANGIHGYLPTAKALREGGWEPMVSAWFYGLPAYYGPRAERAVRERLLALWEETKISE
jgi:hypothetical protein